MAFRWADGADGSETAAIVALVQSAYRGDTSRTGWTTEAHLLDGQRIDEPMLQALLGEPRTGVLLAFDGAELLACCELRSPAPGSEVGYFGMFAVRPGRQGDGLGRTVLAQAESVAREELGVGVLEMTVINVRSELIAWYERRGYHRTGEVRPFPYHDERFGQPKRTDLEFVTLAKRL